MDGTTDLLCSTSSLYVFRLDFYNSSNSYLHRWFILVYIRCMFSEIEKYKNLKNCCVLNAIDEQINLIQFSTISTQNCFLLITIRNLKKQTCEVQSAILMRNIWVINTGDCYMNFYIVKWILIRWIIVCDPPTIMLFCCFYMWRFTP